MRPRLDLATPARWAGFEAAIGRARSAAAAGQMLRQSVIGGYMYLRSLIGPEDLLYTFHDEPGADPAT